MDGYCDFQEKQVKEEIEGQPASMNAFELISLNKGLKLDNFFEADKVRNCCSIVSHKSLFNNYIFVAIFHTMQLQSAKIC